MKSFNDQMKDLRNQIKADLGDIEVHIERNPSNGKHRIFFREINPIRRTEELFQQARMRIKEA